MRVEPVLEHREFYYKAFLQLFPFTGLSVAYGLQRIVLFGKFVDWPSCCSLAIYNIYLPRNNSSFEIFCFRHIFTGQDPPVSRSVHTKQLDSLSDQPQPRPPHPQRLHELHHLHCGGWGLQNVPQTDPLRVMSLTRHFVINISLYSDWSLNVPSLLLIPR